MRPARSVRSHVDPIPDLAAPLLTSEGIQDPYPVYERMRDASSVYWSHALGAWMITGYEEVREVYRDHRRFSSAQKYAQQLKGLPPETRELLPTVELIERTPALGLADPPAHTRQRSRLMPSLTPRQLEKKREWITELCIELAESMAKQDEPDVIAHFSRPLSFRATLGLFGSPLEHVPIYEEATKAFHAFRAVGGASAESAQRHERATAAMREAIESIYPQISSDDGSIIGSLLHSRDGGLPLDRDEIFAMLRLIFSAGLENMTYSIPATILELLRHPGQLEMVKADLALSGAAFEEAVRFDEPNQSNPRNATTDTELAGQMLRAGDRLINVKASANRDPAVWTHPDEFDVTRDQNEPSGGSLSFGQGIHICAGAGVARLEGAIAIATLVQRFPNMRMAAGWRQSYVPIPLAHKLTALPLILR